MPASRISPPWSTCCTRRAPARSVPSGRSMATCCRPATRPVPPASPSRLGSISPRPASTAPPWETILRDNPFPAVHGRVCYHPCETGCNRAEFDSAVSIHAVEQVPGRPRGRAGLVRAGSCTRQRPPRPGGRRRPERPRGRLPSRPVSGTRSRSAKQARCPAACCISASRPTACRATCSCGKSGASRRSGSGSPSTIRSRTSSASRPRVASMRCSSRSGRRSASGSTFPPAMRRASTTPWPCCTTSRLAPRRRWGAAS